jgi:hypothetical protein
MAPREPTGEEREVVEAEVRELLELGVVEEVEDPTLETARFFHRVAAVPKKNEKALRFILDARGVNEFVYTPSWKTESLATVLDLIPPGPPPGKMWMAKLDLRKAFFQVKLAEEWRKWACFRVGGKTYRFCGLPMGLRASPWALGKLLRPVVGLLRAQGILLVLYVDDAIVIATSEEGCREATEKVRGLLELLGFQINYRKSILTPAQRGSFLGFELDLQLLLLSLTEEKKEKGLKLVRQMLNGRCITAREAAAVTGFLIATRPVVMEACLHLVLTQRWVTALRASRGWRAPIPPPERRPPPPVVEELQWWWNRLHDCEPREMPSAHPRLDLQMETDASEWGWGGLIRETNTGQIRQRVNGPWAPEELCEARSINALEVRAGTKTLLALGPALPLMVPPGSRLLWRCDNAATVFSVNSWRSSRLTAQLLDLWDVAEKRGIHLEVRHTPGIQNVEADALSREGLREKSQTDPPEFSLNPLTVQQALRTLGFRPSIDAFASRRTTKTQRFWSLWGGQGEVGVDAMKQRWKGEKPFAYPPVSLILPTLRKIQEEEAETVLVVPMWSTQVWWPLLMERVWSWTVAFPPTSMSSDCSFQMHLFLPGKGPLPPNPPDAPLMFCLLKGNTPRPGPPPTVLSLGGKMGWQLSELF